MKSFAFRFITCLIMLLYFAKGAAICQEDKNYFSISFVPQYLAINAIRIDLEKEVRQGKNRIMIAPYFYKGTTDAYNDQRLLNNSQSTSDYGDDEVSGLGLESLYKFVIASDENASPYVAVGLGYHHIILKYLDAGWETVEKDGLEYLELSEENHQETIDRIDIIGLIGYRHAFNHGFLFDFFLGPVLKNSNIKNTQNYSRVHDNPFYNYGYNGVTLRIGFSLGVKF